MGIVTSTVLAIKQCLPPKTDYTVDKIPDMSGHIVIVTGANTGIGFETAKVSRHYPCEDLGFVHRNKMCYGIPRPCYHTMPKSTWL